ncbi:hypothetical protein AUR64_03850 [Haloprofundus marisrubri]|uniref:Uncharacterized protein n=1 Tax=Haloprofundus marisrubri TaxID=1514971 RepID=A0A0W1RE36_9EURY|nr:hypothetical protein [Haloprofundus marisrubri]KTG11398.1 hypothetical protein AUR64_03850 [Haloprofundus marisrubri]
MTKLLEAIQRKFEWADVAVIVDNVDDGRWRLLRALPALHYMGVDNFTFPTSWRRLPFGPQFDYLDYQYHVLGGIEVFDEDLCVITNGYYESQTQYSVRQLVRRFTASDGTLIVLTDDMKFTPEGGQRPLYQEHFAERVGTFESIYDAFKEEYQSQNWELPLVDTKNLFLQDNANLYELVEDERVETAEALFDVLVEAPYLPLYRVFEDLFARKDEFGTAPLDSDDDVNELGKWFRRRIEWDRKTANGVARTLNRRVVKDGSTFDPSYATRHPKIREANLEAKNLKENEYSIDSRYYAWLTEVSQ